MTLGFLDIHPGDRVVYHGRTVICVESPLVSDASVRYRYEEDGPDGPDGHTMMIDSWLWLAKQTTTAPMGKKARPGTKVRQR